MIQGHYSLFLEDHLLKCGQKTSWSYISCGNSLLFCSSNISESHIAYLLTWNLETSHRNIEKWVDIITRVKISVFVRQLSMPKDILFAMVYCKNVMLFPIFSNFGWSEKKPRVWFEGVTARSSMLINLTNTTMIHSYSFVA